MPMRICAKRRTMPWIGSIHSMSDGRLMTLFDAFAQVGEIFFQSLNRVTAGFAAFAKAVIERVGDFGASSITTARREQQRQRCPDGDPDNEKGKNRGGALTHGL